MTNQATVEEKYSKKPHILVVDDDSRICTLVSRYLHENGFVVLTASSAENARDVMKSFAFDALVVDVMMPGQSGLEFTCDLRSEKNNMPVLILTALGETQDRIDGLETGADDYLPKPFEPRELVLRLQSMLRRQGGSGPGRAEVEFGGFTFHLQRGELRKDGEVIHLTSREKDFLRILAARAGQTVARNDLAPAGSEEGARSVDVQINRLRQKIEADPSLPIYLQTVRGIGYVLHVD